MFMSKEIAKELITKYERLSDKERNLISNGLENYFGKLLTFSTDKLSQMDEKTY
jgi:hypothetical protein